MLNKAQHVRGVAVFVVVPSHDFHECAIQRDTSFSIENGREANATEVSGNHFLVGVAQSLAILLSFCVHGISSPIWSVLVDKKTLLLSWKL